MQQASLRNNLFHLQFHWFQLNVGNSQLRNNRNKTQGAEELTAC